MEDPLSQQSEFPDLYVLYDLYLISDLHCCCVICVCHVVIFVLCMVSMLCLFRMTSLSLWDAPRTYTFLSNCQSVKGY